MIIFLITLDHKPLIGIDFEIKVKKHNTTILEEEKGEEFYLMCKAFNDKWEKEAKIISQSETPDIFTQKNKGITRPDPKNN